VVGRGLVERTHASTEQARGGCLPQITGVGGSERKMSLFVLLFFVVVFGAVLIFRSFPESEVLPNSDHDSPSFLQDSKVIRVTPALAYCYMPVRTERSVCVCACDEIARALGTNGAPLETNMSPARSWFHRVVLASGTRLQEFHESNECAATAGAATVALTAAIPATAGSRINRRRGDKSPHKGIIVGAASCSQGSLESADGGCVAGGPDEARKAAGGRSAEGGQGGHLREDVEGEGRDGYESQLNG